MKSIWFAAILAVAAGAAFAQSGADVVKAKGCLELPRGGREEDGTFVQGHLGEAQGRQGRGSQLTAKLKEGKGHPKVSASDAELKAAVGYSSLRNRR